MSAKDFRSPLRLSQAQRTLEAASSLNEVPHLPTVMPCTFGEKLLSVLSRAERALAQATDLAEVREIMATADAARTYARAAQKSLTVSNAATALKLKAERKAGEILAAVVPHDGGRKRSHDGTVSLESIGINKNQSSRWQRLASIPEDVFESHILQTQEAERELTTASMLTLSLPGVDDEPPRPRQRSLGDCVAALHDFIGQLLTEWPDDALIFASVLRDEAESISERQARYD